MRVAKGFVEFLWFGLAFCSIRTDVYFSKLTWKSRGSLVKTSILHTRPSMSDSCQFGEGKKNLCASLRVSSFGHGLGSESEC